MIITSTMSSSSLPSFPTVTRNTTTTRTTTGSPFYSMSSILSASDRSLIEFTRCLYKAKAIVNELEAFSENVMPTLQKEQSNDISTLISHVDTYLGESFNRFHQMCNALLIVLKKLESNQPMRRESIYSLHDELLKEWHRAESIKNRLMKLIKQHKTNIMNDLIESNISSQASSSSTTSDNDTFVDCQSETSPEANSSESY